MLNKKNNSKTIVSHDRDVRRIISRDDISSLVIDLNMLTIDKFFKKYFSRN